MKKNIFIDCIPDIHFSQHIIPPCLSQIRLTKYDLLFTEAGIGRPDLAFGEEVTREQREIAEKNATQDIFTELIKATKCEPTIIDNIGFWMLTVKKYEEILKMLPKEEDKIQNAKNEAWKDPVKKGAIFTFYQTLCVRRDAWMVKQIKHLLSVMSKRSHEPVRVLLVAGLLHATVLEEELSEWCRFNYLVDLENAKKAIAEYLQIKDDDLENQRELRAIKSFKKLRNSLMGADLTAWGIPKNEVKILMRQVCPNFLSAPRIEKWYYENGNTKYEYAYKNNMLNGAAKCYSESGRLSYESIYRNDKLSGLSRWFYPDGNIQATANYKNGRVVGIVKQFYSDGRLKSETCFKDGEQQGAAKIYSE